MSVRITALSAAVAALAASALGFGLFSANAEAAPLPLPCNFIDSADAGDYGLSPDPHWNNCDGHEVQIAMHNALTSSRQQCIQPGLKNLKGALGENYEVVHAEKVHDECGVG